MTEPTPDIPLLRKCLEWAEVQDQLSELDPNRQWDQGTWHHTPEEHAIALLRRQGFDALDAESLVESNPDKYKCEAAYCIAGYAVMVAGVEPVECWIADQAQRLLGLTENESESLFAGCNDLSDIRRIMGEIAARGGEVL